MSNYIEEAQVLLLDGTFEAVMSFNEGLNILAGSNGTLKTKILAYLKQNIKAVKKSEQSAQLRVEAISPMRNHDLRTTDQILSFFRQHDRTRAKLITELTNAKIDDKTFPRYPSFGELFYTAYEDARSHGGDQREAMELASKEFNSIIVRVFPSYRIAPAWDIGKRMPVLQIQKPDGPTFPLGGLSLGESEVLAVMLNLFVSRNDCDVYLIDEPENHLNWHLEERLFRFFDWYCSEYDKQLIIATHSRVVFGKHFLAKTRFLEWNADGQLQVLATPTPGIKKSLAGEAVNFVQFGKYQNVTLFVEDDGHEAVIEALASVLGSKPDVVQCGNASVVRTMFRYSRLQSG